MLKNISHKKLFIFVFGALVGNNIIKSQSINLVCGFFSLPP